MVKAIIYGADGNAGPVLDLATGTSPEYKIENSVVAALPDGGFALAYLEGGDIRAQSYSANGTINGNHVVIDANIPYDVKNPPLPPTITTLADGRFIVGWGTIGQGAAPLVQAQIFDGRFTPVVVNGTSGDDHYIGSNQSGDILRGEGGNDFLRGEGGDDILNGGTGADRLDGGEGNDIVSYYVEGSTIGIIASLTSAIDGDTYISIEGLRGGLGNDSLTGSDGNNTLQGGQGHDTLVGAGGEDTLVGEGGNDVLYAGAGKDSLWGDNQDGSVASGWNKVSYENATGGIRLDRTEANGSKNKGWAENDVYSHINAFDGTKFADAMIGAGGTDEFYAGNGNDSLEGGTDNDFLFGEAGNDVLTGGAGNDVLDGGTGINTAIFSGNSGQYTIGPKAADGGITVTGLDGTDVVRNVRLLQFGDKVVALSNAAPTGLSLSKASTVENATIGVVVGDLAAKDTDGDAIRYSLAAGSSSVFAIRGNSLVVAGPLDFETQPSHQVTILAKDDFGGSTSLTVTLTVGNAMDTTPFTIRGTAQADVLSGENGNDTIYGSGGKDVLTGHGGKDVFVFDTRLNKRTNVDQVTDFRYQDDSFYLDNKVFTKLGSGTFSKPKKFKSDMFVQNSKAKDAEDRIVYDKKTGKLYYDEDGTGSKAQIQIATLTNKSKLTYQDFFVI
ncbi:cadherin domain-containing protein [Microvirga soli]|uniref:cadherin domain-containing protein n=1 Tax=Microvirga soli TaxID=1854496 RepID=UPI00191CA06A|nr:cadherin domain-containing protein [Microvirga soli]